MRRPTFSCVEQQQAAGPSPTEKESRLSKVKRMITGSIHIGRKKKESEGEKENSSGGIDMDGLSVCIRKDCGHGNPLKEVHIEVAASATTEIVLKPRKRKERLDSGGSLNLETKVIRSSSEERPETKSDANVRRVWSHEELGILVSTVSNGSCISGNSVSGTVAASPTAERPLRELNPCPGEELEARRSSERFSRGRCGGGHRRRKVTRRAPAPEHRSPSPSQPKLDFSSLCRQIEGDEPLPSRANILSPDDEPESPAVEALISPRNSLVMRLTYLDPNMPPSPPQTHMLISNLQDRQQKKISKQINSIKRQLKRYEEGFRIEFGYKPSQADKMANKDIKRLSTEMSRLKVQLSELKEVTSDFSPPFPSEDSAPAEPLEEQRPTSPCEGQYSKIISKGNKSMEDAVQDVLKKLQEKRSNCGRMSDILDMSAEQLTEEKLAVQKALLSLENTYGRPVDPKDRDLARPLYQRYRALKRLVARSNLGKLNGSNSELATILEHETMEFTSASVDLCEGQEEEPLGIEQELASSDAEPEILAESVDDVGATSSSSESLTENLHALPLSQLLELQKRVKEDKKRFRRNLREFDEQFQSETGRRAHKQDRLTIESIYVGYKQSKAKLRLLEALIIKKSQVKRNSC